MVLQILNVDFQCILAAYRVWNRQEIVDNQRVVEQSNKPRNAFNQIVWPIYGHVSNLFDTDNVFVKHDVYKHLIYENVICVKTFPWQEFQRTYNEVWPG